MNRPDDLPGIGRKIAFARLFASVELAWPAWFPLIGVVGIFVILALFDVFAAMPMALHWMLLGLFVVAALVAAWHGLRSLRLVSEEVAIQRLERDSGLAHQPLQTMSDALPAAIDDPFAKALWQRHLARLRAKLADLKLRLPRSLMPVLDPWALRAALGLVLIIALVEGGREFGPRMARAMVPTAAPVEMAAPLSVQLWVTPPAYTRKPPLSDEQTARNDTIRIPAGSEALLQMHNVLLVEPVDGDTEPQLFVTLNAEPVDIEALGAASFQVALEIEENATLVVARSPEDVVKSWTFEVAPDESPEIAFVHPPTPTSRNGLELSYEARDDYGLAEIDVAFALTEQVVEPDRLNLLSPTGAPTELATISFLELTAHPLAGLTVQMWLLATDQMDQEGRSGAIEVVLPERIFTHPLAQAIIAERKRLAGKPHEAPDIAKQLEELGRSDAATSFGAGIPLGLATAAARLDLGPESHRSVIDLLWEIALFIEDGALSLAERELRDLQEQLQRALQEGADDEELQQLMDQLQQALDEFLEEMQRQAMERMQQMSPEDLQNMQPMDPSQMVERQELQEMLDQAREMMENGMREEALDMLAQLQQMMENLQAGMQMQQQQGPSEAEQAMEDLQKMIEMQQNLLDRSFEMQNGANDMQQPGQQGQQGQQQGQQQQGQQQGQQPGQQPGDATGRAAMEQNALRRALGELMRRMGEMGMEIPRSLGQAEMQMRGARDALEQGQPGDAIGPQTDALDQMQQGGQAMMEQLREMMAQMPGQGQMPARAERPGRDPLGRSMRNDGGFDSDGVEVPPENDLGQARGVLEELHRRARDRQRPAEELDYYDRLLDRF